MEIVNCIICSRSDATPYATLSDRLKISKNKFHILKCNCGLIYLNPRPDTADIAKYYHSEYYDPHSRHAKRIRMLAYSIVQKITFRWKLNIINNYYKKSTLLDIGGGDGAFAK